MNKKSGDNEPITLVFLHGFLGSSQDWRLVIDEIGDQYPCLSLDLLGHGDSPSVVNNENGFDQSHFYLKQSLKLFHVKRFILIGYSLGGRIALDYARTQHDNDLKGLILESSHIGLFTETEKKLRYQNDLNWAVQFRNNEISTVLAKWYQQAVFSNLSEKEKQRFITKRSKNNSENLADMLLATSLSQQIYARPFLEETTLPIQYCCGALDSKFKLLSKIFNNKKNIKVQSFADVGHNIHEKFPVKYSEIIIQFVKGL
jgi:2-succinyl-6-hydroxy-2,4-cyclohexadiene-1-carboxylate synthase